MLVQLKVVLQVNSRFKHALVVLPNKGAGKAARNTAARPINLDYDAILLLDKSGDNDSWLVNGVTKERRRLGRGEFELIATPSQAMVYGIKERCGA